ncbi:hypothetical protein J2X31_001459 [Flavobacterium arsenatis]|uniref:Uncharacterized protein n=1 Tax=Flavobacterium arsenatis TaxID=1484332 RepID=A0ABU1TPV3_9FLAO|nr:hypothetical protein [Flavobacterium arsenatis]
MNKKVKNEKKIEEIKKTVKAKVKEGDDIKLLYCFP